MKINVYHHHNIDGTLGRLMLDALEAIIKEIRMLQPEVQALMDQAKKSTDIEKSIDSGIKAIQAQVTDLQAQVAALQAGQVLSDEDKAALTTATSDLAASSAQLQTDIPANT